MQVSKSLLTLSCAALVALAFSASAYAQATVARADIPFEFQANGKAHPAGQYEIVKDLVRGALTFIGPKGYGFNLFASPTDPIPANGKGRLLFEHSGSSYTLTSLYLVGSSYSYHLPSGGKRQHEGERMEVELGH